MSQDTQGFQGERTTLEAILNSFSRTLGQAPHENTQSDRAEIQVFKAWMVHTRRACL
jgi:hypothetical protein